MDPITATIVSGVIWFFAGSIGATILLFLFIGLGILLAASTNKEGLALGGVILGWGSAVVWEIFVVIQVIIHAVNLFKLLQGG